MTINSGVTVSDGAFNNSLAAITIGIPNSAVIVTLTNNDTIEAALSTGGAPSAALVINGGSTVISLINNGTLQATGPNVGNVLDVYGSIGTFDNLGTVYTNRHVHLAHHRLRLPSLHLPYSL